MKQTINLYQFREAFQKMEIHHIANCHVIGAKPLSYVAFIRLVNQLGA